MGLSVHETPVVGCECEGCFELCRETLREDTQDHQHISLTQSRSWQPSFRDWGLYGAWRGWQAWSPSCNPGLPGALRPGLGSYLPSAFFSRNAEEGNRVISEVFNTQGRQGGDWDPYQGCGTWPGRGQPISSLPPISLSAPPSRFSGAA